MRNASRTPHLACLGNLPSRERQHAVLAVIFYQARAVAAVEPAGTQAHNEGNRGRSDVSELPLRNSEALGVGTDIFELAGRAVGRL